MSLFKKSKAIQDDSKAGSEAQPKSLAMAVAVRGRKKKMAKGGVVETSDMPVKDMPPAPITEQPPKKFTAPAPMSSLGGPSETALHSMASKIMAKRKMADGGAVKSDDKMAEDMLKMADGGQIPMDDEQMESSNYMDERNHAILKEHYGDDIDSISDPMDSNEHGDMLSDADESGKSLVDAIRRKMKSKG